MKSISGIKRIYEGELYISVTVEKAIELQNKGIGLKQFGNLKSLFIKQKDLA